MQQNYDKIENLLEEGRSLYQGGHFESIGLQESCKYLEDMYKKVNKKHEERRNLLILGKEFHQLLNEVRRMVIVLIDDYSDDADNNDVDYNHAIHCLVVLIIIMMNK